MQPRQIVLLLAFGVVAYGAGIRKIASRNTVPNVGTKLGMYKGEPTTIKDHPSLGAVLLLDTFFCEATIVSSQWVATIGDCAYGASVLDLSIVVASEDGINGTKYGVKKIVSHPKYGKDAFDYDYALIQIKGKFNWSDKVKAVSLPKSTPKPKSPMIVAGWGSTSSFGGEKENKVSLLQGTMTWLNKKTCKSTYESFGVAWTDRMACAYNKGKTTLCSGDWADAFIEDGVFYGMFVAGATKGWCSSEAPPILLADVAPVADWIHKTTGAAYKN